MAPGAAMELCLTWRLEMSFLSTLAERNPPIEEVISQGVIPRFVQFLQRSDLPPLQVR